MIFEREGLTFISKPLTKVLFAAFYCVVKPFIIKSESKYNNCTFCTNLYNIFLQLFKKTEIKRKQQHLEKLHSQSQTIN